MKHRQALLAGILLLVAAVLGPAQQVVEEIVAIVNDEVITLTQFKVEYEQRLQAIKAQLPPGEQQEKSIEQLQAQLLEAMITDTLLLQLAKEKNINVADQVKMALDNVKKENNLESDDDLRRALASQGIEYEAWLKQMEETILRQSVVFSEVNRSIVIDDAEVVDFYKKRQAELREPEEYTLRAVYLAGTDRTPEELEAKRSAIDAKLKGGADFAALAGEDGDAPMKENKGELGTIKKGEMDKTLLAAVEPLKKGEVSAWTQTKNGWYLLKLEEKKDVRVPAFEEARKQIEERIFGEKQGVKLTEFLDKIKKTSFIKILKPNPIVDK
jgi:parvulin-like peptidyl-prolyl isomerase